MIGWTVGYIIIAVLTALVIAGYGDNGWGARRCIMLGAFWIISLPFMAITIGYNRFINRGST